MPVKIVLGLPYLSDGPLLKKAVALRAPVLVSANSFSRWKDLGPAPKGMEYSRAQWLAHEARGTTGPITHGRKQRMREWEGWNLRPLKNATSIEELWLDSAGFHMMFAEGGYPWTPEQYIFGLCAAYPWTRFSSLDLCVEEEIAHNRHEVNERIAKTVRLNIKCHTLAEEAGLLDRLMPVIQGANADDYLRCFERLHPFIGDERLIGIGSMCRRKATGEDGIVSVVDALDRRLPKGVLIHMFGLKSDGAESVANMTERVYSIDSQAYGVRARHIANDRRKEDPEFSKSNAFVAEVMASWYQGQVRRMDRPRARPIQNSLLLEMADRRQPSAIDVAVARAHAIFNELIERGDLAYDQIISDRWIEETVGEILRGEHNHDDDGSDFPSESFPLAA
ncbi:hypothetical protein [Sphingosinicella sp. BN140058]|uniref:deazapurine DNA modification protein DpdA family protein n=1 Tax=Sphingosinicella sp. BN140058 TaxID=1892855 RepID=UPI001013976B|nr:hypothetical protein [Sphingosinicella sp. BN140058]QAY80302.1 hypothetical protein ETR14_27040 [Sphingosinicella sp. BN140058]